MDASWMDRLVYGSEPNEPAHGPKPGHAYVELVGGPLDGMLLDVTGWDPQEVVDGAMPMSEHGQFGPGGRSEYEPAEADAGAGDVGRSVWRGVGGRRPLPAQGRSWLGCR
ncbi:hypothetical protein ACIGQE_21575 [Streptomyces sp. NPDC053429]|uniref:hypothetical protein n=1 Tax=Streptomyces sp. NPDC053429 TaxID=3365702 RepID=UPI0037D8F7D2